MKLYIEEIKSGLKIKGLVDFELKNIFECGQCFRWYKEEDESYTVIAFGKILNIKKELDSFIFNNTNKRDFEDIWYNYFDLDRDYSEIKRVVSVDNIMKEATEFGSGIRILKQEPWEMMISFIISARNSIPNIKKTIEKISQAFGKKIGEYNGVEYFSFPTAKELKVISEEELKECGTSFRTKYILSTAKKVFETDNIDLICTQETKEARESLMEFSGIGPKVSDCILLFGMRKYDVFPVDVWVYRVIDEVYTKGEIKNLEKIREYGINMFGGYSGFGQQYLFYYAREKGIGKK